MTRKFVSKAKINLNKYWHKFEEILSVAGEDIKSMSSTYHDFIASQKCKYYTVDRMSTPEILTSSKLPLLASLRHQAQNNVQDELNTFISKSFDNDINGKNVNESTSTYKPFVGDDLYYGVNLNTVPNNYQTKRCSCHMDLEPLLMPASNTLMSSVDMTTAAPQSKYQFSHRNIRLSTEDCENLENEAFEVYKKYSYYDTSF